MLDYAILDKKKIIKINNEQCIDLLCDTFNKDLGLVGSTLIVNKYYIARPDLISLACYGDDKYADIICKVNGISNPFELNEDDILFIPSLEYIMNCTLDVEPNSDIIKNGDDEIYHVETTLKRRDEKRSPNELTIGDSNFVIDHSSGIVFY